MTFSQNFACPEHGISISDLSPRLFSFNNPLGACEKCTGLGTFMRVDEERILPNRNLSIREGAIKASGWYLQKVKDYDVYEYNRFFGFDSQFTGKYAQTFGYSNTTEIGRAHV